MDYNYSHFQDSVQLMSEGPRSNVSDVEVMSTFETTSVSVAGEGGNQDRFAILKFAERRIPSRSDEEVVKAGERCPHVFAARTVRNRAPRES
jgi:hypothetical protein